MRTRIKKWVTLIQLLVEHRTAAINRFKRFLKNSRHSLLISPIESGCHIVAIIISNFKFQPNYVEGCRLTDPIRSDPYK